MSTRKPEAVGNVHDFVVCQIDVVNKQLVSPRNWNDPLSETSFVESYMLMIYRHLDVKEKHSLDFQGVYKMEFHVENNLILTTYLAFQLIF